MMMIAVGARHFILVNFYATLLEFKQCSIQVPCKVFKLLTLTLTGLFILLFDLIFFSFANLILICNCVLPEQVTNNFHDIRNCLCTIIVSWEKLKLPKKFQGRKRNWMQTNAMIIFIRLHGDQLFHIVKHT